MKKVLMILMCCAVLSGCSSRISQKQYESVVAERDSYKEKLASLTGNTMEEPDSSNGSRSDIVKTDNSPTSEQLLLALKSKNENIDKIQVFDENTDPNGKLGRPGYYVTKADFSDSRVEQIGEYLCGGTIETFATKEDCISRAEYLKSLNTSDMGAFGVNQYIYEYELALFRIEYDLTPEQAEEYQRQMTEIIEQWGKGGNIASVEEKEKLVSPKLPETDLNEMVDVKEYSYQSSGTTWYIMELTNNSPATISVNTNVIAKDSDGNMIGAASASENAIENGYSVCLKHMFNDGEPNSYEYTLSVKEDEYYKPVLSDLSYEESDTGSKVVITCTNNGEAPAKFVEGIVLFFSGDKLLRHNSAYFTDDDSQLKPGNTIAKEFNFYGDEKYDNYKVYFTGRR